MDEAEAADCARREAMEEGGLKLGDLVRVGSVWTNPSTSTERVTLFIAEYEKANRVACSGGLAEENECLQVHELSLQSLLEATASAELADAKTLLLVQALQLRRPDLFVPSLSDI